MKLVNTSKLRDYLVKYDVKNVICDDINLKNLEVNGERIWHPCYKYHTEVVDESIFPTCLEVGYTAGKHCSECGEILIVREEIPAKGHTYSDWIIDKKPTTAETGSKHIECIECGHIHATEVIPVLPPLVYKLSDDGTCYTVDGADEYISGEVNIPSEYNDLPVIAIADEAFLNCSNIISVIIPNSVIAIGDYAFAGCSSLEEILIPDSVMYIGEGAFSGCVSLINVAMGDGVIEIDDYAFYQCASLPSIAIPDGVTTIGYSAFNMCYELKSIVIPDSVTSIGEYALGVWMEEAVIPALAIPYIDCQNLKTVVITSGEIGDNSFRDCDDLTSVVMGDGVTSIGRYAFLNCSSLANVEIGNNVTFIGSGAFQNCSSIISIVIPDSVVEIDGVAFSGCTSLTNVNIPDGVTYIDMYTFDGCTSLTDIVIPDSVTYIDQYAFCECTSLASVVIGDSVESIGFNVFSGCTNLASVVIGSSVREIEQQAFEGCDGLTHVYYYGTKTEWSNITIRPSNDITDDIIYYYYETNPNRMGNYWHYVDGVPEAYPPHVHTEEIIPAIPSNCVTNIKGWSEGKKCSVCGEVLVEPVRTPITHRAGPYIHENEIFATCTTPGQYDLVTYCMDCGKELSRVTSMSAIRGHINGETVVENNIAPTCTETGSYENVIYCTVCGVEVSRETITVDALGHTEKRVLDIEPNCTTLGKAHYECTVCGVHLREETLFQTHEYVNGNCKHENCRVTSEEFFDFKLLGNDTYSIKVKDAGNIPNNVTIPSTHLGKAITVLENSAFENCTNLTSVVIPDSVTNIGADAFENCTNLTSVVIGDNVTMVGITTFKDCTNLTSVVIGDGVTSIGTAMFKDCKNLTNVVIGNSVTEIGAYAFENCWELTSIEIPDSVISIDEGAFKHCTYLASVVIGNSVTSIGDYAFASCYRIASVVIPDSVTSIGKHAFVYCDDLTSLVIGNSVTTISDYAFDSCTRLTSVVIGNSVTSIGKHAFACCDSLTNVVIPDSVTSIGQYAFAYCDNLDSVIIGNGVKMIDSGTFNRCPSLTSVEIGNKIESIETYAFGDSPKLTTVILGNGTTAQWRAFHNSNNIYAVYFVGSFWAKEENGNIGDTERHYVYSKNEPWLEENKKGKWHWVDGKPTLWACGHRNYCLEIQGAVSPTCTNVGYTEYRKCLFCGEVLSTREEIPATGHSYTEEIVTYPACTTDGLKRFTCHCGHYYDEVIPAIGHSWSAITITEPATCMKPGIGESYCGNCGQTDIVVIPKVSHSWGEWHIHENEWRRYCQYGCNNYIASDGDDHFFTFVQFDDNTYGVKATNGAMLPSVLSIPSTYGEEIVSAINDNGFLRYNTLTHVEIGEGITIVGESAFAYCSNIIDIVIPDSVANIGAYAFSECNSLDNVILPSGIDSIKRGLFMNCTSLSEIVIPNGVTSIYWDAFYNCSSLAEVYLPDSVTNIHSNAFDGCSSLTKFIIPASVNYIGHAAFKSCTNLTLEVNKDNRWYRIKDGCLWEIETCAILSSVNDAREIPADTIIIGAGAFYGNIYSAPIKIPLSVTTIGSLAFGGKPITVHVEADSKPEGWADDWCDSNVTVVWGYVEDTITYLITEDGDYLTDEQGNLLII